MQTVTIDILNDKAMRLLQDLELLQLIRVRREKQGKPPAIDWVAKYKGAMVQQPQTEVDEQLKELRGSWE